MQRNRRWGTSDQEGLRIKSFVGIKVVSEPGFGAKEPPLGTPDQAGLRGFRFSFTQKVIPGFYKKRSFDNV